jgi:prepilin peptidase CpaA
MITSVISIATETAAGLLLFAAVRDVATRMVPNWVSLAILAAGIVLQAVTGDLAVALGLGLLVFFGAAVMWRFGWLGGADVKLLGAAAVAVPCGSVMQLLVLVSLTGGVLAVFYLALSLILRRPRPGPRNSFLQRLMKAEAWRIHRRGPLPYAVAIACGGVLTLFPS